MRKTQINKQDDQGMYSMGIKNKIPDCSGGIRVSREQYVRWNDQGRLP